MRPLRLLPAAFCILLTTLLHAQEDSSRVFAPDADTAVVADTADTAVADSLSPAERARRGFEERRRRARETQSLQVRAARLALYDSLVTAMVPERMNQREWLTRSFYLDAADYFKFDASFFGLPWQLTPMRSTVQPYGLAGDRLSVISHDLLVHPFERSVEADGLINLEDLPVTLDGPVYLLHGAHGMVLGGDQAIATLHTRYRNANDKPLQSSFVVDKGQLGYSFVRGKYSKRFADGREADIGVGYRVAQGVILRGQERGEDAYFYDGNLFFPLGDKYGLRLTGHLFDRESPLYISSDRSENWVNRDRFDRSLRVAFTVANDSQTVSTDYEYRHLRQGSYLTSAYKGRFNYTGHGLGVSRQWYGQSHWMLAAVKLDRLEYDHAFDKIPRYISELSFTYAHPRGKGRWAVRAGAKHVDSYRVLPFGALTLLADSDEMLILASVGYAERAPALHELFFRPERSSLYGSSAQVYSDAPNRFLAIEKQATVSLRLDIGKPENAWSLQLTGGYIMDGIDWSRVVQPDGLWGTWLFTPINDDIGFTTASLLKRLQLGSVVNWIGGASYHFIDYASQGERPYQPEYQAFSGLELHWLWKPKLIHFWGYGEVTYVGEYHGYDDLTLGNVAQFNGKLGFSMGSFRFRVIWQNALNQLLYHREYTGFPGYLINWGFDWNFTD